MRKALRMDEKAKLAAEMGVDLNGQPLTLAQKYGQLRETIIRLYDARVWFLTDACLAVHVSNTLEYISNPIALILVGGPSTEKTTVLDFFDGLQCSYKLDKFTTASFLTQARVGKQNIGKIDLLPKIVYKTLIVPEMGPFFNQPREVLAESYALMTRVLDGNGLRTAGGLHGTRELIGDYMFGFLGATTPISPAAWNLMGKLGSRMMFINAPAGLTKKDRKKRAMSILVGEMHYKQKKALAKKAVADYLLFFFSQTQPTQEDIVQGIYRLPTDIPESLPDRDSVLAHCGYLPRCTLWDQSKDNMEILEKVSDLTEFLTCCRGDIKSYAETTEGGKTEICTTGPVEEGVDRLTALLGELMRSHALLEGRTVVNDSDLCLAVDVAFSSLPDDRRIAIELLISENGEYKDSVLAEKLSGTTRSAQKVSKKLGELGVGKYTEAIMNQTGIFVLDKNYDWFLSESFREYYRIWDRDDYYSFVESGGLPF